MGILWLNNLKCKCDNVVDRDYNASKNIKEEGFRILSKELAC